MIAPKEVTMTPEEESVAIALYEIESVIYGFRISWEDCGKYRKFCYLLKAQSAIAAIRKFEEGDNAHDQTQGSGRAELHQRDTHPPAG